MTGTIMPDLDRLYFYGSCPQAPLSRHPSFPPAVLFTSPVDCIPIRLLLHAP